MLRTAAFGACAALATCAWHWLVGWGTAFLGAQFSLVSREVKTQVLYDV
jgi:hypothetical protein